MIDKQRKGDKKKGTWKRKKGKSVVKLVILHRTRAVQH